MATSTTPQTDADRTDVVEFYAANEDMSIIRCHRWGADYDENTALSIFREWTWNYRTESYTEDRHTFTLDVTPNGTVEHDGRSLEEYGRSRVRTLSDKRGLRGVTVERTE